MKWLNTNCADILSAYQVILLEFSPHRRLLSPDYGCATACLHTVEYGSGGNMAMNETSQVYMLATESDIIRGIFHY
jgi:hypothetical protein